MSWAAAHLRAVMADPDVPQAGAAHAAQLAVKYLLSLATELRKGLTK